MGNLQTPISVQKLRTALHAKAKEEPEYRFYLLYDKIYRRDVLDHAYRSGKANPSLKLTCNRSNTLIGQSGERRMRSMQFIVY